MKDAGLHHLIKAYRHLLSVPGYTAFRHANQPLYAALRDEIATQLGEDPESVQNFYENEVWRSSAR
jgi:hypothetical protein